MAADRGRKTHSGCCLLPWGGGGVLGVLGGLRFKAIAQNLNTEATLVALLSLLFSIFFLQ